MTSQNHTRANVLVVDDEPGIRRFAARVLLEEGYGVLEAGDGLEALEVLQSAAGSIEVVVTDIVMPGLHGVELMQKLSVSHPDLPVILMSGYGTAQLAEQGIAVPCAVLAKPFTPELLLAEVRRCIRRQAS